MTKTTKVRRRTTTATTATTTTITSAYLYYYFWYCIAFTTTTKALLISLLLVTTTTSSSSLSSAAAFLASISIASSNAVSTAVASGAGAGAGAFVTPQQQYRHFLDRPKHRGGRGQQQHKRRATTTRIAITMTASDVTNEEDEVINNNDNKVENDKNNKQEDEEEEEEEDPYSWLEEVESERSLEFCKSMNTKCLNALGDPKLGIKTNTYERVLEVLESSDRIPHVGKYGIDENGDDVLYNFWKDGKNPRGIWRRTTLNSYKTSEPKWTTVLNIDELNSNENESWVWKGATPLPRSRDFSGGGGGGVVGEDKCKLVTRALIHLSRGGSDATVIREFCLKTNQFVNDIDDGSEEEGFYVPEAKSRVSYKSRNVLYVGSNFDGPGLGPEAKSSLTDSGYPRIIKEWTRGLTSLQDAPTIFEGESSDVSVSVYISDERFRGEKGEGEGEGEGEVGGGDDEEEEEEGPIYEVRQRALTFYTSRKWVRTIRAEHLLPLNDPKRQSLPPPEDFIEIDVQEDAEIDFFANLLLISLRSDWMVGSDNNNNVTFKKGCLLAIDYQTFVCKRKDNCDYTVLFEPNDTNRTALETYTATKNYLILSILENVKSKLIFQKLVMVDNHDDNDNDNGSSSSKKKKKKMLKTVGGDVNAFIQSSHVAPVDSKENDLFWFTTSGYTQPSTLYLADANLAASASAAVATTATATAMCPSSPPSSSSSLSSGDKEEQLSLPPYVTERLKSLPPQYNSDELQVLQRMATSLDGTQIPYFIVMPKNQQEQQQLKPTLLYGYGGFEVSLSPRYTASAGRAWLERGGIYVEANIRGGGEFGPSWHQSALKENRNKCNEDFIAVAEHLIATKICTQSTLGIRGGSNGGLLMGNMYVLRPDLFGCIHCAVPLLDMKRYSKLLAGASWMAEYGNPDTSDWDNFLKKYSPYHTLDSRVKKEEEEEKVKTKYPPILFTTSTKDDRVHPAHARKMVKKIVDLGEKFKKKDNDARSDKSSNSNNNNNNNDDDEDTNFFPVYYYENMEGGHGGAADSKQSAFMTALAYDFMWDTLSKGG